MNIVAQASDPARRRAAHRRAAHRRAAHRRAAHRRAGVRTAIPAALAAAAIASVSGCSSLGLTPSAHTAPPAPSASPTVVQSAPAAIPTPAATVAATPAPSATPTPVTTSQGALTARVTILGATVGLVPGGKPVRFKVTVTNSSSQTYGNILPLVSLGHCTCTANNLFPAGRLQERESTTNVWQTIPYDVEGFGTGYLNVTEPGGIQELPPGGVATFEYRVALSPATSAQVTTGTASLDVTLLPLPSHTPIGSSPGGSAPVYVASGQPPA
jgi:hypothetical protein